MAAWLRKEKGCHAVAKALFLGSLSAQSDVSLPRQDYRSQIGTGQSEMPRWGHGTQANSNQNIRRAEDVKYQAWEHSNASVCGQTQEQKLVTQTRTGQKAGWEARLPPGSHEVGEWSVESVWRSQTQPGLPRLRWHLPIIPKSRVRQTHKNTWATHSEPEQDRASQAQRTAWICALGKPQDVP